MYARLRLLRKITLQLQGQQFSVSFKVIDPPLKFVEFLSILLNL